MHQLLLMWLQMQRQMFGIRPVLAVAFRPLAAHLHILVRGSGQ